MNTSNSSDDDDDYMLINKKKVSLKVKKFFIYSLQGNNIVSSISGTQQSGSWKKRCCGKNV